MKNFGTKSVSSVFSVLLNVAWYFVLVGAICGGLFYAAVIVPGGAVEKFVTSEMTKDCVKNGHEDCKDLKDMEEFVKAPLALKMLAFPYVAAVVVFLLMIIRKSREIFNNFKNDIVFNKNNVELIGKVNKLMIIFSILTFNFSGLLTCVMLYMLGEIFKNGAALQEEHDLTV